MGMGMYRGQIAFWNWRPVVDFARLFICIYTCILFVCTYKYLVHIYIYVYQIFPRVCKEARLWLHSPRPNGHPAGEGAAFFFSEGQKPQMRERREIEREQESQRAVLLTIHDGVLYEHEDTIVELLNNISVSVGVMEEGGSPSVSRRWWRGCWSKRRPRASGARRLPRSVGREAGRSWKP